MNYSPSSTTLLILGDLHIIKNNSTGNGGRIGSLIWHDKECKTRCRDIYLCAEWTRWSSNIDRPMICAGLFSSCYPKRIVTMNTLHSMYSAPWAFAYTPAVVGLLLPLEAYWVTYQETWPHSKSEGANKWRPFEESYAVKCCPISMTMMVADMDVVICQLWSSPLEDSIAFQFKLSRSLWSEKKVPTSECKQLVCARHKASKYQNNNCIVARHTELFLRLLHSMHDPIICFFFSRYDTREAHFK